MALYRHRVFGTFPGESWTFGVYSDSNLSVAAAQSAFITGITNFWSTATALFCTDVEAVRATTVEVDPATGRQLTGAEDTLALAGTSTATCLPFQCARRMLTTARDTLADAAEDLMQGITASGGNIVIYHRASGTTSLVTSLDVGDVIDTQRRRRNKLIEARTSRVL
jgi:hypothetical protein